jgi:hypothetical protein
MRHITLYALILLLTFLNGAASQIIRMFMMNPSQLS